MKAWVPTVVRAVIALALAAVITFSADHSATFGLVVFGSFGVITGAIIALAGVVSSERGVSRGIRIAQGAITFVAGLAALLVIGGGLPYFVFLVSVWAAITGFLELYLGLRLRRAEAGARDSIFVGALTAVVAIAVLLVPPGYTQNYTVSDFQGHLTASIIVVGLLGAYFAILGVYLVIAGLSLKWGTDTRATAATSA